MRHYSGTLQKCFMTMKQQELEMYNAIRQHYWWLGLQTFVKNYVQGCGTCQQFKIDRHPSKLAFLPTKGAKSTRPFMNCSMDLITDLPPVDRFDSILVMVDQGLSKGVIHCIICHLVHLHLSLFVMSSIFLLFSTFILSCCLSFLHFLFLFISFAFLFTIQHFVIVLVTLF